MYPPLNPHSPVIPLETEWNEYISTFKFNSSATFLNEINFLVPTYIFS